MKNTLSRGVMASRRVLVPRLSRFDSSWDNSHVIVRSLPGDIKEKGLAVWVEIGGGMFLTQLVETGL